MNHAARLSDASVCDISSVGRSLCTGIGHRLDNLGLDRALAELDASIDVELSLADVAETRRFKLKAKRQSDLLFVLCCVRTFTD